MKMALLLRRFLSTSPTPRPSSSNPFETTIRRRRVVVDPSYPDFEKQECLKWTDWKMLRDVKRRHMHAEHAQNRLNLKNIARCRVLPSVIRDVAWDERMATPRAATILYLRNRCALSSRPEGIVHQYRVSRIVFRDAADHGLVSGVIRAKWG